jgi:hypothetical protein
MILALITLGIVLAVTFVVYCALVVSARCSRAEEARDHRDACKRKEQVKR